MGRSREGLTPLGGGEEFNQFYRLLFVLGIFLILVSMFSFMFYHAIMTWDYGPFYFPASE